MYRRDNLHDGSYEPITGKTLNVSDRIDTIADGETLSVNIRQKGTATLPSGLIKSFTLYPRLAAPTSVTFNSVPLTLTGCSSAMQYRTDTQTAWTNLSSSTLQLTSLASAERDVVVAPEVEEVPDATPEVEGIPETTPEVEGTSEATPETEGTPEDESIPETMPKMEDLL